PGLAQAVNALVRLHLDDKLVAVADPHGQRLDVGDAHDCMFLSETFKVLTQRRKDAEEERERGREGERGEEGGRSIESPFLPLRPSASLRLCVRAVSSPERQGFRGR